MWLSATAAVTAASIKYWDSTDNSSVSSPAPVPSTPRADSSVEEKELGLEPKPPLSEEKLLLGEPTSTRDKICKTTWTGTYTAATIARKVQKCLRYSLNDWSIIPPTSRGRKREIIVSTVGAWLIVVPLREVPSFRL
jgi:hypothetical protein